MGIFKPEKKETTAPASAPEEQETDAEIKHIEDLNDSNTIEEPNIKKELNEQPEQDFKYKEIPVCMSQEQINNLVIENNIILKQIIANME